MNLKQIVAFAFLMLLLCKSSVFAQLSCSGVSNWNSSLVYWANDQVSYNGNLYKAKWYTQNQTPGDIYGPWAFLGSCNGAGGSSGTSCASVPTWNTSDAYNQDTEVIYNSKKYKAKWYTQSQIPGDIYGPWE